MKVFLVLLILFFNINLLHAQEKFHAGIIAGMSTSQVAGDTYSGFNKAGIALGAFSKTTFTEKISAQFEILYIQKGSKHVPNIEKGNYDDYLLQLNYIEVPILIRAFYKNFIYEAGPSFGVLVKNKESNNTGDITGIRPFHKTETGINAGIGYPLSDSFEFNVRYSTSILPIRPHPSGTTYWFNLGQTNTVISFTLHYQINVSKT